MIRSEAEATVGSAGCGFRGRLVSVQVSFSTQKLGKGRVKEQEQRTLLGRLVSGSRVMNVGLLAGAMGQVKDNSDKLKPTQLCLIQRSGRAKGPP